MAEEHRTGGEFAKGFAAMDPVKQRELASKGGKAAHAQGTAHKWNSETAKKAGKLGGMKTGARRWGKPRILILADSTDDNLMWLSDGWNAIGERNAARAARLMTIAREAIDRATGVKDAIRLLQEAGFELTVEPKEIHRDFEAGPEPQQYANEVKLRPNVASVRGPYPISVEIGTRVETWYRVSVTLKDDSK